MINMDIPSAVLKERAKATLRGTYWTFVGATLIVAIVSGLISGIAQLLGPAVGAVASIAVALFYTIPVSLGVQRMYIRTAQGCGVNTNDIFNIYKSGNLMNAILVLFLKGLFTFLWSLLFVIPGIIKGYSYLLIDYMMAENPALDQSRAFEISKQLARRMSIARDTDANFAAILACTASDDATYRYSGYFMAFSACYEALEKVNPSKAAELAGKISGGLRADLIANGSLDGNGSNYLSCRINTGKDASSGTVANLLVAWHVQLTTPVQEEEAASTSGAETVPPPEEATHPADLKPAA